MMRPHWAQRVEADAVRQAITPGSAWRPHIRAASRNLVQTIAGHAPPAQHIVPVLAIAEAMAGLVLLFGDPALIDVVAEQSRRILADGSLTILDLFPNDTAESP